LIFPDDNLLQIPRLATGLGFISLAPNPTQMPILSKGKSKKLGNIKTFHPSQAKGRKKPHLKNTPLKDIFYFVLNLFV
jgi:hypothetical protein